jgi:hypothetical protein
MKLNEYKDECSFQMGTWKAPGLAHVVEIEFSERVHFCNFVMQITTDHLAGAPKKETMSAPAALMLPGGRTAVVHVIHAKMHADYLEIAGAGKV